MDELLEIARAAARVAGEILLARFGGRQEALATKSSATDPVGEADLAAERAIRELLAARRPEDAILGEEGGGEPGTSGRRWVVDPLDGTVNYLYGIPQWCVSVACEDADGALAGVVFDPVRGEEWSAERGGGLTLNGAAVSSERATALADALIGTGFGYAPEVRAAQGEIAARVLPRVRDLRRAGSAALDLAWTAAGRLDGYYERGVKPWDVGAGRLLCTGAGLAVRSLPAAPPEDEGLLAAPPAWADELAALVG